MTSRSFYGVAGVCVGAALIALSGCGGVAPDASTPSAVLEEMRAREGSHHDVCLASTSIDDERGDTRRYVDDMSELGDEMIGACNTMMMGGGAMTRQDRDRIAEVRGRMHDSVEAHQARMNAVASIDAMDAECDEHHAAMLGFFDEMM